MKNWLYLEVMNVEHIGNTKVEISSSKSALYATLNFLDILSKFSKMAKMSITGAKLVLIR